MPNLNLLLTETATESASFQPSTQNTALQHCAVAQETKIKPIPPRDPFFSDQRNCTQSPTFAKSNTAMPHVTEVAMAQVSTPITAHTEASYISKHNSGQPYSMIALNTGLQVHLTNSPNADTLAYIENNLNTNLNSFSYPPTHGKKTNAKIILGKGGQGKVRVGIIAHKHHKTTACLGIQHALPVAIKKSTHKNTSLREIHNAQTLKSKYLPKFYGWARQEIPQGYDKYYLVYELINGYNGTDHGQHLSEVLQTNPQEYEASIYHTASEYTKAIQTLHEQGYYHSDVKLDNFLHDSTGRVYLCDLGLSHNENTTWKGGTTAYNPPEILKDNYQAGAHDAFSLGITLLALSLGGIKNIGSGIQLQSSQQLNGGSQQFTLYNITPDKNPRYGGLENTTDLKINDLHDVIIKLLDKNPQKRLTIAEAAQHLSQLCSI